MVPYIFLGYFLQAIGEKQKVVYILLEITCLFEIIREVLSAKSFLLFLSNFLIGCIK